MSWRSKRPGLPAQSGGNLVLNPAGPVAARCFLYLGKKSSGTTSIPSSRPAGRFEFTFTPKHGSWLNLVEGFSKLARSILRRIRVASKQELKDRLMAAVDYFNNDPVVHTWTYKLDKAA